MLGVLQYAYPPVQQAEPGHMPANRAKPSALMLCLAQAGCPSQSRYFARQALLVDLRTARASVLPVLLLRHSVEAYPLAVLADSDRPRTTAQGLSQTRQGMQPWELLVPPVRLAVPVVA